MKSKWKTGTPPLYQDVLIYLTFPQGIMDRPKVTMGYCDDMGYWRTQYGKVSGVVTHWQLLPAPPESTEAKQ
jgi:hypothetical protein